MFEVGQRYEFKIIEDSAGGTGEMTSVATVEAVEGDLLRLSNGEIVNTASRYFVRATRR